MADEIARIIVAWRDEHWLVTAGQRLVAFGTKYAALSWARRVAKDLRPAELVEEDRDGTVILRYLYKSKADFKKGGRPPGPFAIHS